MLPSYCYGRGSSDRPSTTGYTLRRSFFLIHFVELSHNVLCIDWLILLTTNQQQFSLGLSSRQVPPTTICWLSLGVKPTSVPYKGTDLADLQYPLIYIHRSFKLGSRHLSWINSHNPVVLFSSFTCNSWTLIHLCQAYIFMLFMQRKNVRALHLIGALKGG